MLYLPCSHVLLKKPLPQKYLYPGDDKADEYSGTITGNIFMSSNFTFNLVLISTENFSIYGFVNSYCG